jgi:hypothetical protein
LDIPGSSLTKQNVHLSGILWEGGWHKKGGFVQTIGAPRATVSASSTD